MLRFLVSALALLALGCATARDEAAPRQIYVMRHLQAGTGQDPALTEEGGRQAQLLAGWFERRAPPRAIYASTLRRGRETAAPLAAKLGIEPKLYDPSNTDALIAAVAGEAGSVLIVGHSNTVPGIVERLGRVRPGPIEHHRHGDIWIVSGPGRVEQARLD
jgi:phosphohistidine phosphatase SixA